MTGTTNDRKRKFKNLIVCHFRALLQQKTINPDQNNSMKAWRTIWISDGCEVADATNKVNVQAHYRTILGILWHHVAFLCNVIQALGD